MNIRQKNGSLRITFDDPKVAGQVSYLLVEPAECWVSTFNAWGKSTGAATVNIGGKMFLVRLEPVS